MISTHFIILPTTLVLSSLVLHFSARSVKTNLNWFELDWYEVELVGKALWNMRRYWKTPQKNVKWPVLMSHPWTNKSTLDIFVIIYFKAPHIVPHLLPHCGTCGTFFLLSHKYHTFVVPNYFHIKFWVYRNFSKRHLHPCGPSYRSDCRPHPCGPRTGLPSPKCIKPGFSSMTSVSIIH